VFMPVRVREERFEGEKACRAGAAAARARGGHMICEMRRHEEKERALAKYASGGIRYGAATRGAMVARQQMLRAYALLCR